MHLHQPVQDRTSGPTAGGFIMKLYFAPGACSLAPHIVAREAGLKLHLDKLDFTTRITEGGEVFSDVNPKGYVPALRLDDGSVLTEVATLVQYLADQAP